MSYAVYQVVGSRNYRGHQPGDVFTARLDRQAARRAIQRGDITFIRPVTPNIQPGTLTLPDGWPPGQPATPSDHRGAARRLSH